MGTSLVTPSGYNLVLTRTTELRLLRCEPGIYGYYGYGVMGPHFAATDRLHDMNIVDKIQLPRGLALGDYVLSFRWDCEQNPQIWSTCADIRIEGGRNGGFV